MVIEMTPSFNNPVRRTCLCWHVMADALCTLQISSFALLIISSNLLGIVLDLFPNV